MKVPELKDLEKVEKNDAFSKTVESVKVKSEEVKKKTFSLMQQHLDYINTVALGLSQEKGRVSSASEALRLIIEQHSRGQK